MSDDEDERTIWCGNLAEKVTHDILYELFYQAGPLEKVRIPRGPDGLQRNFGFVTYTHKESVPYAIKLFRGISLYDRDIRMQMQRGAKCYNPPSADLALLLGRPNMDSNIEQKFIAMTNQMIINGGRNDDCSGYEQTHNQQSNESQWANRHNGGRERRRHEPYRRDRSNDRRGRERDRDRDKDRSGGGGGNGGFRDRRGGDRWGGHGRGHRY